MKYFVLGTVVLAASFIIGCDSSGGICCDGEAEQQDAPVLVAPVARIKNLQNGMEFNKTASDGNLTLINLDGSTSTDSDGTIMEYKWEIGSDELMGENNNSIRFNTIGTKTIYLTVKDNDGLTDSTLVDIEINERFVDTSSPKKPFAALDVNKSDTNSSYSFSCKNSHDDFEETDSDHNVTRCDWNIRSYNSDGSLYRVCLMETDKDEIKDFVPCASASYFIVKLTVTDDENQTDVNNTRIDM